MRYPDVYAHSRPDRMFDAADVYGVGVDEERAKKRLIRLAIMGVGGVAQSKHLPAIARLRTQWEPIEVVGYCTRNQRQTEKLRGLYGGAWYTDPVKMLDEQRPDGVIITSADDAHIEQARLCIERGIGVLVEKPLARSLTQAKALLEAADQRGCLTMTVANKRYAPPYRRARREIAEGCCKNPAMLSGKFNLGYDYVQLLEGGTVHLFDLCRYLMGDVSWIEAHAVDRYGLNRDGYPMDNGVCTMGFSSGALGSLITSSSALSLKPWERVEVYARNSWLCVDDQWSLSIYDSEQGPEKKFQPVMPNTLMFDEEFGGFMPMIQDFADCLREGNAPLSSGWDGYRAYELVCAFHISAHTGRRVELPLDPEWADGMIRQILGKEE